MDEIEREILSIRQFRSMDQMKRLPDLVNDALGQIEFMVNHPGQISGMATGFGELDLEIDGMQPSDLIVVAAYPSVGKTSFALNIVEHVALASGVPRGRVFRRDGWDEPHSPDALLPSQREPPQPAPWWG